MGALAVHAEPGSRVPHRGHAVRHAYHLFAATSRITSSSRSRSTRGFFRRAFASCSLFSSPTWRGCMQRIDAATRTASAQRPGTFGAVSAAPWAYDSRTTLTICSSLNRLFILPFHPLRYTKPTDGSNFGGHSNGTNAIAGVRAWAKSEPAK